MLPGYVSGFYPHDDIHVPLDKLARFAGARFVLGEATDVDTKVRPACDVVRLIVSL
jgi:selenide,water dikinase